MPMKVIPRLLMLTVAGLALACAADTPTTPSIRAVDAGTADARTEGPYTFAAIGDMPYGQQKFDSLPLLINLINADPTLRMTVHVGDIKAGKASPCTDTYFASVKAMYDVLHAPFVYTPGDNEWTDCHVFSKNNGLFTPTERLQAIRSLFFPVPGQTLGVVKVAVTSQGGHGGEFNQFVENVWFPAGGVTFATVNITGSDDDLAPWGTPLPANAGNYPSQAAEHALRLQANLAWIRKAFASATTLKSNGIVLAYQADMWDPAEPILDGFDPYVTLIGTLAAKFGKPVLLIHGDSHVWRVDQPFTQASPFFAMHPNTPIAPNVTRLVVEGSTNRTEYTRISIDRSGLAPNLFSWVRVPLQ
jgi:hypothetical protein